MYKIRLFIYSIFKREILKHLSDARKRLKMPQADLEKFREKEFLKLIEHVKKESPYYKKILRDLEVKGINDLSKIPILTKNIIKKEYNNIVCESDKKYLKQNSTSGSTGEATLFGSDTRFVQYNSACLIRANELNGSYRYLERVLKF